MSEIQEQVVWVNAHMGEIKLLFLALAVATITTTAYLLIFNRKGHDMGLFTFHKLNNQGQDKAIAVQEAFETLEDTLENICERTETMENSNRSYAIAQTKLDEACMWAKKSVALQKRYQERE